MSFGAPFGGKFPEMRPISSPPSLQTINGVGLMVYGSRDYDEGTNTYVVTLFFTFLFIPIFALKAYRVSSAPEGGWYFYGKVPLSLVTRGWNILMLLGILCGAGAIWHSVRGSDPATMAAAKIAEGDQLAAEGKIGAAAERYNIVAYGPASATHGPEAVDKLCALFDAPLDNVSADQLLPAFVVGVDSFKVRQRPEKLIDLGLAQAKKRADADATTTLKLLDLIAEVAPPGNKEIAALKKPLLEKLVAREPDNLDALSDLAAVYYIEKNFEQCEKLLLPKKAELGTREGARILGKILVDRSQFEEALPLLETYAEQRLERFRAAEESQKNAITQLHNRVLKEFEKKNVPGFDLARFESLQDQKARDDMFRDYISKRLRNDPDFRRSNYAILRESVVVPVALDLGIALMRRGQMLADPEARKAHFEKAEKTFLRIRGSAGQTEETRLRLGQVYYWLGKADEGKKVFDEILQGPNVEQKMTIAVARMLREVGAVAEARKLLEEGFEKDGAIVARDNVARIRSLIWTDIDDRIAWLQKIQNQVGFDKAELSFALGDKALSENRDAEAEAKLREALGHYGALPEDYSTLNNSAFIYFSLYKITGDPKDLNQGIANLEKAVELLPRDSIVVQNAASNVLANAVRSIIGNKLDWKVLKINGSMDLLNYLHNDAAKKDQLREQVRKHDGIQKARGYYDRLAILAPKSSHSYLSLDTVLVYIQDREAINQLRQRVERAGIDHADSLRRALEFYQLKDKDRRVKDLKSSMAYHEKRVADARKVGGATLSVAIGQLQRDMVSLFLYGESDAPNIVALAEEAHKAAPSRATHNLLIEALLVRAHQDLVKTNKDYEAMATDGLHSLGVSYLMAAAITKENGPQKACLAHRDVQRANAIIKSQSDTYADEFTEWSWAMLHKSEPDWAAHKAMVLQENELAQMNREIARQLTSLSTSDAYRQHWARLMQGQADEANDVLRRLADKGVPLPK